MKWEDANYLAFDFETSGTDPRYALQPWRIPRDHAWATSLVWLWKDGKEIKIEGDLHPGRDLMAAMLEQAIKEQRRIIGWNTAFDISILLAYDLKDLVMRCKWLDAMLLWKHWFLEPEYEAKPGKRKSYGLKAFVTEHLTQFAGYEDEIDFHDESPAARSLLHEYNVRDTLFTLRGARLLWDKLTHEQQRCAIIEAASLPLVAQANLRGLPVDMLACAELRANLAKTADDKLTHLAPLGVTEKIVRSPIQLAKLMYDDWGLKVLKENTSPITKKVSRSTDKEVLHELAFDDPRAKVLKEYREALNNKTKFADAPYLSARYNEDGCVHPSAMIFGTYSGRLTYGSKQGIGVKAVPIGFALHQMKRGAEFRCVLKPPEGFSLLEFDASGQEYRWMAIASRDPTMLAMCQPGEDPHSFMGAQIAEKDYKVLIAQLKDPIAEIAKQADADRKLGKVGNLSLQYRTSARKLRTVARVQYLIPMEMPQAQAIHGIYRRTYKEVPVYWDYQIEETKQRGYVETFAGRRVQVVGNWSGPLGWSMGSTAINYRIQGTGADQKYLAMAVIKDYINEIGAYFAWDLHDGIYLFVPDRKLQEAAAHIKHLLDNLPYEKAWGFSPPIPLPWDCKAGGSWGNLKEYTP